MSRWIQPFITTLSLVGLVLTACSPAPAAPAAQVAPTAQPKSANQTVNVAQIGLPASLSPEASAANISLYGAMYDPLTWRDEKNNVVPWAATKWSQINPTTWRFALRNDLTFSNGDKLTAADVEFTLNLIAKTSMPQISQIPNLTGAKMVDEFTVDVMSKVPDASLLPGLLYAWIMPQKYYEAVGKAGFSAKPVGSGPFELDTLRAADVAMFKRRATEHPFRKTVLTNLNFRSITEQSQMATGLQTGDLDIALGAIKADVVDGIAKTSPAVNIIYRVTGNISALISQPESKMRNTPLQDIRVRWAMNYAIDKEAIAKNLYRGYAKPTGQLALPDSPAWDESIKPIPYDPATAKKLLAEAGYPNGFKLDVGIEFSTSFEPNLPLVIQSQLRDIGIEAPAKQFELAVFLDKYYGRNGQVKGDLMINSVGDTNGFYSQAQGLYSCDVALVWWCNPEFDRNMQLANAEPDPAKRAPLMKKAVRAFYDDVANILLVIQPNFLLIGPKAQGFVLESSNFYVFDRVYKVD